MFNLSDIELTKLCRTCLSIGEMKSLFEKSATEPDLAEMLMTCTPVEYYANNGLPEQVCQDCFNEISRSYKFAIKCRQTDDKLQVYLQNLVKLKTSLICHTSSSKPIKPDIKNKSDNPPNSNSETDINNQSAGLNLPKLNIDNVYSLSNALSTSEIQKELNQELDICKHEIDLEEMSNIENVNLPSEENDLLLTDVRSEVESNLVDVSWLKTEIIDDDVLINEIKIEIKIEPDDSIASTIDPLDYCCSPDFDQNNDIKTEEVISDFRAKPLIPFTHSNPVVVLERLNENSLLASPQCDDSREETELNSSGSSVITRHLADRVKHRAHPCPMCEKSFFRPYELKRHIKNHNREIYACKICKRQFNDKANLVWHARSHPQVCPICNKTYRNYNHLQRHKLIHTKQEYVSCQYCNKTYRTIRALELHVLVEHNEKDNEMVRVSCQFCNKKFARAHVLKQHISLMHTDPIDANLSESTFDDILDLKQDRQMSNSYKKYECNICKKYFSKYYIKNHMLTHANDKVHTCPICKETFTKFYKLKRHYSSHRIKKVVKRELGKTEEKQYSCRVCVLYYNTITDLNDHMLQHTDKISKCLICDKEFIDSILLMKHMLIHQNDTNLSCTICKRTFRTNYHLRVHEPVHDAPKPLPCGICSKVYPHNRSLRDHQRKIHGYRRANRDQQKPDNARQSEHHTPNVASNSDEASDLRKRPNRVNQTPDTQIIESNADEAYELRKRPNRVNQTPDTQIIESNADEAYELRKRPNRVNQTPDTQIIESNADEAYELRKRPNRVNQTPDTQIIESNADETYELRKRSPVKTSYIDDDPNDTDCDSESSIDQIAPLAIENGGKPSKSKSMPIRCSICKKTFKANQYLRLHMRYSHCDRVSSIDRITPLVKENGGIPSTSTSMPIRCGICKKTFKANQYLRQHMRYTHLGEKPTCLTCQAVFKSVYFLKRHRRQHHSNNQLTNTNNALDQSEASKKSEPKDLDNLELNNENSQNTHSSDTFSTKESTESENNQRINNDSKWRRELAITEAFISVLSKPNIENYQSVNKYSRDEIPNNDSNSTENYHSDTENYRYRIPISNTNYQQGQSSSDYQSELSKPEPRRFNNENYRNEISNIDFECRNGQNHGFDSENYRNELRSIDAEYRNAECSTELLNPQNYQSDEDCENELSMNGTEYVRNTDSELSMPGEYQKLLKSMEYQNQTEDCDSDISNDQSDRCSAEDDDGQSDIINVENSRDGDESKVKDNQNQGIDFYEPASNEDYKKYGLRKRVSQIQSYTEVSDEELEECRDRKRRKLNVEIMSNNASCKLYSCSACHTQFANVYLVKRHLNSHRTKFKSAAIRYSCEVCEHPFRRVADLEAHQSVHLGPQPFTCTFCDVRFVRLSELKLHMHSHDDDRQYACAFCARRYKAKAILRRHEECHNRSYNYECEVCNKQFCNKSRLQTHMGIHTRKQSMSCSICEEQFPSPYTLQCHMNIHNGRMYTCVICKHEFATKANLSSHMINHSGLTFDCTICFKNFKTPKYLKSHLKSHSAKIFKCTLCDEAFTMEQALLTHMRKMH